MSKFLVGFCIAGGVLMHLMDRDSKALDKLVKKLKELRDHPSCGPVVDKRVSIEWLLEYIETLRL